MDYEDVLYLENIEEFVNDEDRIVTYKWLSRTLSVPANRAKQMLYTYFTKQKQDKNGNNISATYIVGGKCNVDGQMTQQFVLTNDENLDDSKSCLDVVTSVHIYSLQKSKPKDSNALYTVDYNITQEHKDDANRWNHIYCKDAKPFEDGGASRAKGKAKPGKENHEPVNTAKTIVNGQGTSNQKTMENTQKPKASNQKSKKGQLPTMGLFATKTEKSSVEKEQAEEKPCEEKKHKPAEEKKSAKPSKASGSMLSFFGKQVPAQQKSTDKKEEKTKTKTPEKEPKKTESKQEDSMDKTKEKSPDEAQETKKAKDNIKESSHSMDKGKDKAISEKKPKETKKTSKHSRKRIKNLDSSDEEEEPIPKKFNKLASDSESNSEDDSKAKKSKGKKKKEATEEETKTKKRTNKKEKKNSEKESHQDEHEEKPTKTNRKRKKDTKSVSSEEESPLRPKSSNKTVVSETPVANQHSTGNPAKRRKRIKVMRSKTYVDDDGFMVTEKVYESESTDASDEEPIPVKQEQSQLSKKASPESKPKKVTEMKPVKQASLMSFFKKS